MLRSEPDPTSDPLADLRRQFSRHRQPAVVSIGTFDGVHQGHRALIASAASLAASRGLATTVVTFSPRPESVFDPESALPDICSPGDRVARLRAAGADSVLLIPFSRPLANVSPEDFCDALVRDLGMRALCVGEEFALGRGRAGNVERLRELGLEVLCPELVRLPDGRKVSSSTIRRRLSALRLREEQTLSAELQAG